MITLLEVLEKEQNLLCNKGFQKVYSWFLKRQTKVCLIQTKKWIRKTFKCCPVTYRTYLEIIRKHNKNSMQSYKGMHGFVKIIFW